MLGRVRDLREITLIKVYRGGDRQRQKALFPPLLDFLTPLTWSHGWMLLSKMRVIRSAPGAVKRMTAVNTHHCPWGCWVNQTPQLTLGRGASLDES